MFVCLFVLLFLYIKVSSGGEVADYIKCELIGGGYPRHLNTSVIDFVYNTHINTCFVKLLLLTVTM